MNAVDQAPGLTPGADAAPSGTPSRVSMIELDDWILAVNVEEHEKMVGSIERVMVDSGAAVSVCPLGYAPEIPMTNYSRRATLRTAAGAQIERPRLVVHVVRKSARRKCMCRTALLYKCTESCHPE